MQRTDISRLLSERCRDRVTVLGFTTTYKYAATTKVRVSRIRHRMLWVESCNQSIGLNAA